MCGVPFHSADGYIAKLVSKGYKVAVCEQLEDPKTAKGIVKRDVIRVITAGTVIETGKHSFFVACGEGVLEITEVQPESKKRMPAQVFLNGRGVQEGDLLA